MTPVQTLAHEHNLIILALEGVERRLTPLRRGEAPAVAVWEQALDLFREFADRCHHGKEERQLFPALVPHADPQELAFLELLRDEHVQGRSLVAAAGRALADLAQGQADAAQSLTTSLTDYVALLRAHIDKENRRLFPMTDRLLSAAEQTALEEAFDRVEREEMGAGVHDRYHQLAHELAEK